MTTMRGPALFVALLSALLAGCPSPPPPAADDDNAALRAELAALRERVERAEQTGAATEAPPPPEVEPSPVLDPDLVVDRSSELDAENEQLRADLASCQAEAARYRHGLEEAIGQLNAGRASAGPRRAAAAPAARPRVSTLGAPDVQILGDQVFVSGRLWNAGDADAVGELEVELLLNGRVQANTTLPLDVPANTEVAYSHTFQGGITEGTYSARVRIAAEAKAW